jgi:hypothetical protein
VLWFCFWYVRFFTLTLSGDAGLDLVRAWRLLESMQQAHLVCIKPMSSTIMILLFTLFNFLFQPIPDWSWRTGRATQWSTQLFASWISWFSRVGGGGSDWGVLPLLCFIGQLCFLYWSVCVSVFFFFFLQPDFVSQAMRFARVHEVTI